MIWLPDAEDPAPKPIAWGRGYRLPPQPTENCVFVTAAILAATTSELDISSTTNLKFCTQKHDFLDDDTPNKRRP